MIKYRLNCKDCEIFFDSWFSSSNEYERLKKKNFIICHICNSLSVEKTLMSPSVFISKNDSKVENQLILGRDPDYAISTETVDFGDSFSIIVNTHISRVDKLNLIPLREGKYPTTVKLDGGTANLLG